jgi:DNA topoisomerase-2
MSSSDYSDSDDDSTLKKKTSVVKRTTSASSAPKKAPTKKKSKESSDNDNDDDDDNGNNDEIVTTKKGKKNVEDIYKKTNLREHILNRPDSYIGTIEQETDKIFITNANGDKFIQQSLTYVPGLFKIFDEILVNAADNKQRDPRGMTELRVEVNKEKNRISVYNNGKGIPIQIHKEYNIQVAELIFGQLLTSSNYDDDEKRTVGGRNGFGAKLANIFSKEFIVETCDGKQYLKQVFTKNMSEKTVPDITKAPSGSVSWTRVTFSPDLKRFGMSELEDDIIHLIRKRTYDVAGTSGRGLKVYYNNKSINIKDFKSFCEMHLDAPSDLIYEQINDRWEVAIAPADSTFTQVSFVNRISTLRGGTHVNAIVDQVVKTLSEVVGKKSKKVTLKPQHFKQHLWVFVNALVENPTFDTQTKVNLTSKKTTFGSNPELSDTFTKKVAKSAIVASILSFAQFQQDKELKKNDSKKKTSRLLGIAKLEDANMAGTRNSDKCTLIITEGDSAKALAMSGLSVVGRDYYGVFPIRGKLLNVRDATTTQILENAEITSLKQIIGLQQGRKYDDVSTLRYGHIMIMTDQDHDGSHIKGLIINMFATFWPTLLKMPGFLTEFITPIVKVSKGRTAAQQRDAISFYTLPEYEEWQEETSKGRGWNVKYYKGLGTSSSAEAKVYFSNIDSHQIPFRYKDEKCLKLIEMLFSKNTADERKNWLTTYIPGTYLSHAVDYIPYQDFINKELILFSIASNQRAIPSLVDGLKPAQRKILFSCFKRNLKKELKVAQLSGYVAEQSAYHHGEASLAGTIVTLAQNYVGSNNINYLWPSGQFGTRAGGGRDAASARYIFTYLSPVTRTLFHPLDDPLLNYLNDDGQPIEPEFYVPILPTVLINGSSGIGTGWSSEIFNHNPKDLIDNVKKMLNDEEPDEMHPWYKNFIGEVSHRQNKRGTYSIRGLFDIIDHKPCTVHIYELPIGGWTSNYKTWLETLVADGSVIELSEYHTDVTVSFLVTFSDAAWVKACSGAGGTIVSLRSYLKLESSMTSSNMVLFDAQGKLHRYDSTIDILKDFFPLRLEMYEKRKNHLISTLSQELRKIDNKVRFIKYVIEEKIKMRNIKRADLLKVLQDFKFDPLYAEKASQPASLRRDTVDGDGDGDDDGGDDNADEVEGGRAGRGGNNNTKKKTTLDSISEGLKGYSYLTSLPLLSLTYEKVQELLREKAGKEEELMDVKNRSTKQMWLTDLDEFEVALNQHEDQELEELRAGENAKYGSGGLRGGGSSKKGKKKMDDSDSDDDGFNSDDDWGTSKKKKAPKKAAAGKKDKKLNIPDFILSKFRSRPSAQTYSIEEETELDKKKRLKQEAAALVKMGDVAELLGLTGFDGTTPAPKKAAKKAVTKGKKLDIDSDDEVAVKKPRGGKAAAAKPTTAAKGKGKGKKDKSESEDDFLGSSSDGSGTEDGFYDSNVSESDGDGSNSDSGSESEEEVIPRPKTTSKRSQPPPKARVMLDSDSDGETVPAAQVKRKNSIQSDDDDDDDDDSPPKVVKKQRTEIIEDPQPVSLSAKLLTSTSTTNRNVLDMMNSSAIKQNSAPVTKKTTFSLDDDDDDDDDYSLTQKISSTITSTLPSKTTSSLPTSTFSSSLLSKTTSSSLTSDKVGSKPVSSKPVSSKPASSKPTSSFKQYSLSGDDDSDDDDVLKTLGISKSLATGSSTTLSKPALTFAQSAFAGSSTGSSAFTSRSKFILDSDSD